MKARRMIPWIPPASWALLIFLLSSEPSFPLEPPFPHFDKLVHMGLYGVLCGLLIFALRSANSRAALSHILAAAVLASFLYGITDEIHQSFVPGRSCDSADALANLAGAVLASMMLARFFPAKLNRR